MKTILVTGGAGYIGSIAVNQLVEQYKVIVIDNLSKGKKELINPKAIFYHIDLTDKEKLNNIFKEHKIDCIIHFASYKAVEESMSNAVKYSDNIIGTINLLNNMVKHKAPKIIFSSSAAVYGIPKTQIIDEQTELKPINYYGFTKKAIEEIIKYYHEIHNIQYISLRYFNVAGDVLNYLDPEANNIFPIIMEVITGKRDKLKIFGDDYNTPDHTCIRDYIHVSDLVQAHIKAINTDYNGAINLGTGKGYSVLELVKAFQLKNPFKYEFAKRRKGDCEFLVASNQKAKEILKWTPKLTLKDMIDSTFKAYE